MNSGNNWMPQMSMPPLGFGVVMPQPGGGMGNTQIPYGTSQQRTGQSQVPLRSQEPANSQWQMQFGMMPQNPPGSLYPQQPGSVHHQQPGSVQTQQHVQQQQQQWLMAQQKAAKEQMAMQEKLQKQRQFDNQRSRLKEFESRKKKATVSADTMIQNIFSKEEETARTRTPKDPGSAGAISRREGDPRMPLGHPSAALQSTQIYPGPYTSSSNISFTPSLRDPPVTPGPQPTPKDIPKRGPDPVTTQKPPLAMPLWLTDPQKLPQVYTQASNLAQSSPGWVDTGRAYMLLMRTGVPPPLLGILWENVNRTQPGTLRVPEFHALLALVACVQKGHTMPSLDSLTAPVYPVIDHPTLLPLAQGGEGLQDKPPDCPNPLIGGDAKPQQMEAILDPPTPKPEPDEFDDFVSAERATLPSRGEAPTTDSGAALGKREGPLQTPFRNLPTLGPSPPLIRNPATDDDDFDDFQSAVPPTLGAHTPSPGILAPPPSRDTVPPTSGIIATPTSRNLVPTTSGIIATPPNRDLFPPTSGIIAPPTSRNPVPHTSGIIATPPNRDLFPTTSGIIAPPPNRDLVPPIPGVIAPPTSGVIAPPTSRKITPPISGVIAPPPFRDVTPPTSGISTLSPLESATPLSPGVVAADLSRSPGSLIPPPPSGGVSQHPSGPLAPPTKAGAPPPKAVAPPTESEDDRYAVLRNLDVPTGNPETIPTGDPAGDDDAFGSFCSSSSGVPTEPPTGQEKGPRSEGSVPPPDVTSLGWVPELGDWGLSPPIGEVSSDSSNYVTASASADTSNDDDDFGDFVGPSDPNGGKGAPPLGATNFPRNVLGDTTSETQSVASLELPDLDLTVNLPSTLCENGSHTTTPRLDPPPIPPRMDEPRVCPDTDFDRQFQSLRLEEPQRPKSSHVPRVPQSIPEEAPSVRASSLPLNDRYSSIREEVTPKNDLIEPHIGQWKRCLEGCHKLLKEGVDTLKKLREESDILHQVVATSQMKDYLCNLGEVWLVCRRIETSNGWTGSNPDVDQLLGSVRQLWTDLLTSLGKESLRVDGFHDYENLPLEGGTGDCCNLCLSDSGGVSLVYGGRVYHPPCANLWLNVVDLTLPSASHARPTLL